MADGIDRGSEMTEATATDTRTLDELCINTIRTLSMDAVEKAKSRHPDGAGAARLRALHAGDEAQPVEPGLVRPRPLRAVGGPRLDAALLVALPDRLRPHARRPQALSPARLAHGRASP